ncbi:MAG TPA: alpha/beta hydrolase [Saprospiraceae bacterium]|nr:alpha/beta hydrolase [Saprospiraceae bacterium]
MKSLFSFFLFLSIVRPCFATTKEYVEIRNGEKLLTGIFQFRDESSPVIYFLQGFTCMSIGNLSENHPYNKLVDGFLEKGFSVFQLEKSGFGKFSNSVLCADIGFAEEVTDFEQGYEYLKKRFKGLENKIFIFGHSLGGSIAPLIATKFKPSGIVVYGAGIRSWSDYLIEVTRYQGIWNGRDYEENGLLLAKLKDYYYRWFNNGESLMEICRDTAAARVFSDLWGYSGTGHYFLGRHELFFRELNSVNYYGIWKWVSCPVYAIYGEADVEAIYPDDMKTISEIINHYKPGTGKFLILEGTDHLFAKTGTIENVIKLRKAGEYGNFIYENFNPAIIDEVTNFFHQSLE